jgi:hypothetical protein
MKRLFTISLFALLFGCYVASFAQSAPTDVLRQLLSAPAPPPPTPEPEGKRKRSPKFFDINNVPPDDAPLQDLQDYWNNWAGRPKPPTPSTTVSQRLIDAAGEDFRQLERFLTVFSPSASFAERIKQVFDKEQGNPEFEGYQPAYKKWLLFNSKCFIGDLLAKASKAKDNEKDASIENAEELIALAKVDWSIAEPLLQTLVNTAKPRTSTLALSLLYQHSVTEKDADAELKLREKLQSIASNRDFSGHARDTAIEALSVTDWSGRDEWYLSLFSDESLIDLDEGQHGFAPLNTLFDRDPDKWIPVMTKLIAGKDRTVQQAAASCLVRYVTDHHPRRDAIMPILRWLTEPDWIPISGTYRTWFMQYMDDVEVPESVPGLIWIVENEEDSRDAAARTLAHYKDPRAIPALKKALVEVDEDDRSDILQGLVASGGLSETEQVNALEAYASFVVKSGPESVERYRANRDEPLPLPVSIGVYLAGVNSPPDSLVRAVLARAANLRKTNDAVSRLLRETAHRWQGRQVDLDLVKRIATNTAEAATIVTALERRAKLRESVRSELHSLMVIAGMPQGIGAILLEDNDAIGSILTSGDQPAQIALLASARLTQTALPIDLVGPLLNSKNSLLASAAERYLLVEDSKQARTLLWQQHPNEAFITGWRENVPQLAGDYLDQIGKVEDKLRDELLKPGGPLEIFALLANYDQFGQVLRIYPDKAVYTYYEDAARYRERVVPKADVSIFKEFVSNSGIADLGPQFGSCHHNCWVSEFLMVSREAGRRVFSRRALGSEPVMALLANFGRLGKGATTHYNFEKEIKGLEVLYSDGNLPVRDVWQQGDEIRIFVERDETEQERANRKAKESEEEDNDNAIEEQRQRELARYYARFSWRTLKGQDAASIAPVPDGYSTFDVTKYPLDEHDTSRRDDRAVQAIGPDTMLIARNFDGLWKQVAGSKAVRITGEDGAYVKPVVTPDGKWVVVSKGDSNWSEPNYLVRLNLETGREFRVDIEPADDLDAIAFLPLHDKILLRRAKADERWNRGKKLVGPDVPEYYLIDPKTGQTKSVSGEFAPLLEEGKRFLQPADEVGQYWAAIPDRTKNQTAVGRYNLKDFSFKPLLTVPQISFESLSMWVDQKQGKLYLVYQSQLLSLPLKSAP